MDKFFDRYFNILMNWTTRFEKSKKSALKFYASAKLGAQRGLVLYVPRALLAVVPHVPRTLRALVPYVPRAARTLCLTCSCVSRACCLCNLVPCALWSLFPYELYCFLPCVLYALISLFYSWGSMQHAFILFFNFGKFTEVKTNIVYQ